MFCSTGDSQSEIAGVETLLQYRVAGIVFLAFSGDSRTLQETLEHQVPVVFVSCSAEWGDVVSVDDTRGGRLGTEHLIATGHTKIAYLSIPELEDQSDQARYAGYLEALGEAGLEPTRISWSPPSDHAEVGAQPCRLLDVFKGAGRATAVFASNDVAAILLQEFADRVHLRVPQDVSIVGFDDVPMAGLARIGLTTVAQPRDELAKLGIDTIADRIEHKLKGPPRTTLVEVNLIARRSTSPPATS
jgi:DNA-binding LacI/PurR family transcriptional regulator